MKAAPSKGAYAPLQIAGSALAQGQPGVPYTAALQATGGTPAYHWSLVSGRLPHGLSLSHAGVLSGTPGEVGTFGFVVQAADSGSPSQNKLAGFAVTIATHPLTISASSLGNAEVGYAYAAKLQAAGGTPGYTWSLQSGSLPAGVSVTPAGMVVGTPTNAGNFNFAVKVSDSGYPAQTQIKNLVLKVTPALTITSANLAAGQKGRSYNAALQATGGMPGYSWSVRSGSLPAGLNLSGAGVLSGTPAVAGTSNFTVQVTDSSSPAQTHGAALSLTIATSALSAVTPSLPTGQLGQTYGTTLQASGGTPGYSWSLQSGSLPAGLSLSTAGVLSGTPTAAGTSTFTVQVSDSSSPVQTQTIAGSVTIAAPPLAISSSSLANAQVQSGYATTLKASGGTPNYVWSVTGGNLPAGLNLSTGGVLSGTPTAAGASSFTVQVSDSGSPAQVKTATLALTVSAPPLTITSSALAPGQSGAAYNASLSASGGVPAYSWSVVSGSLPAGLNLNGSTGVISGTPTGAGTAAFTVQVADAENPAANVTANVSISVAPAAVASQGTTWFVRPDGGTRYSANVPNGQCDGKADSAYPGIGVNQHCAFNDLRFLWDDNSGAVKGLGSWIIAGGDTVIVRGCTASATQTNASNPDCRLGWDNPSPSANNNWCYYVGTYTCWNPTIPAGTPQQHTRILGQNYANCNVGGGTNPRNYASNLTQLFAGFATQAAFNLMNTQYVDIECLELTTHNGQCTSNGYPSYPRPCNHNQYPMDDFAGNGFITNSQTSNITFQDVYVHGFNASGFSGPIGGPVTMTRVFDGFNGFAGWNFDDGNDTPDAAGSQILAHFVTMIGNGCYEEYPVKHPFSAQACYDDNSNGFGDAWSGQDTNLDTFVCDHCVMAYNTKDAFIGPHTFISNLTITNSQSYGNMGSQWKWDNAPNANVLFENNLTIGNCARFSDNGSIPGATQSFALSSGQNGAYLSDFCRAAGNTVAVAVQANSNLQFANNTFVNYIDTGFLMGCGPMSNPNNGTCGNTTWAFTDNIFLGYSLAGQDAPGLFYITDPTLVPVTKKNISYGNRPGGYNLDCSTGSNLCADPLFENEPVQQSNGWSDQNFLDNFNFNLSGSSPAKSAGVSYAQEAATDVYGTPRTDPPTIGAVQ